MSETVLMFEVLLQGIGILISWNAILTSFDWLNSLYPDYNVGIVFTLLYISPVLVFQPLTTIKGNQYSYNLRVVGSYAIVSIALFLIPICASFLPESLGFFAVCILISIIGIVGAIAQVSIYGLGGTLPDKYMNLVMIGNAIAGILTSALRLICLGAFTGIEDNLLYSSIVYYMCAGFTMIVCIVAQIHLMKHPLVISCTECQSPKQIKKIEEADGEYEFLTGSPKSMPFSWEALMRHTWEYVFLVWTVYFVTFAMLTHVALATEIPGLPYSYFGTLLIFDFNLFDFIGRYFCAVYFLKRLPLWVLTFLRFVFWGTFVMIASGNSTWGFTSTWFKFLNMAVYAFTNGYFSTLCMIYGPAACPDYMKDRAGYVMAGGLTFGIFSGTLVAFAFSDVGTIPSD